MNIYSIFKRLPRGLKRMLLWNQTFVLWSSVRFRSHLLYVVFFSIVGNYSVYLFKRFWEADLQLSAAVGFLIFNSFVQKCLFGFKQIKKQNKNIKSALVNPAPRLQHFTLSSPPTCPPISILLPSLPVNGNFASCHWSNAPAKPC